MKISRPVSFVSTFLLLSSLLGSASSANAAVNPNCNAIDGDYIVSFAPGVNIDNEISKVPGRAISPKFKYSSVLNGFAASLTAAQVCAFQKRPNIENIELDGVVTIDATQSPTPSWGLDRIDQIALNSDITYNYRSDGAGVTAYVIDTGIQTNHPDFGGKASVGSDFVKDGRNGQDCNGHGTHVAGTIGGINYGVAKKANLVAVRVLNCRGSGTTTGVIAGIDWVAKNNKNSKAVANLSLGGGISTSLDSAINNLISKGVIVVVAAGNSAADACNSSPARVPNAITVAASTNNDNLASFSNRGACIDIIAPGESITSDWIKSGINTISGTSMASPHVAGGVARYLSTNLSAAQLLNDAVINVIKLVPTGTANKFLYLNPTN